MKISKTKLPATRPIIAKTLLFSFFKPTPWQLDPKIAMCLPMGESPLHANYNLCRDWYWGLNEEDKL